MVSIRGRVTSIFITFNSLCWVLVDKEKAKKQKLKLLSIPFVGFTVKLDKTPLEIAVRLSIPFVGFNNKNLKTIPKPN